MKLEIVVRLKTSNYFGKNSQSVVFKKELKVLKRKSNGDLHDLIHDIDYDMIVNLYEVDDGLYMLSTTNESIDFETGHVDGYDLILVPYDERHNMDDYINTRYDCLMCLSTEK